MEMMKVSGVMILLAIRTVSSQTQRHDVVQALASLEVFNWWPAWRITFTPDGSPAGITDGQVLQSLPSAR